MRVMSISSINSSSSYSHLKWPQTDGLDGPDQSGPPSDPLLSLFQSFSGGSSSGDPLLAALSGGDNSSSQQSCQFSPDMMQALFSAQSGQSQPTSGDSQLSSLIGKFDANGDGQISQSEFENAIGSNADTSKVDELFSKIDTNGDGSISSDEIQSAMQKALAAGGHHHHHHMGGADGAGGSDPLQSLLSGASADGTTSQTTTNSDGSTTTTLTYADGTKIDMTTPAASSDGGTGNNTGSNPQAPSFASMLKQLISLQAQLIAPTTSLSV
jgi:hypothetical protein